MEDNSVVKQASYKTIRMILMQPWFVAITFLLSSYILVLVMLYNHLNDYSYDLMAQKSAAATELIVDYMSKESSKTEDGEAYDKLALNDYIKRVLDVDVVNLKNGVTAFSTFKDQPAIMKLGEEAMEKVYEEKAEWIGTSDIDGDQYYVLLKYIGESFSDEYNSFAICVDDDLVWTPIKRIGIILLILGILAGGILTWSLVSIHVVVSKPLRKLREAMSIMATGDMRCEIERAKYGQEMVDLCEGVAQMQENVRGVVLPILATSSSLSGDIDKVSSTATVLARAANNQAASLEEISASMEEMGATVQNNTDNSIETNKVAQSVEVMLDGLGKSSKESYEAIGSITKDIENIKELVSQTSILALNASVEAARAGEQGKGFAVVAKEVGALATQVSETSLGISDTAQKSIAETEQAYDGVQQLLPKIHNMVELIKGITTSSVEQNANVTQVNGAIAELNDVTQQNAQNAAMLEDDMQNMQQKLSDMQQAVSIFKV